MKKKKREKKNQCRRRRRLSFVGTGRSILKDFYVWLVHTITYDN